MMAKNSETNEIDALFKVPLAEFTGARNTLAARLKQSGRGNDATLVKALSKPSVSAWTVNQLYWNHREAFERLIAAGQRVQKIQMSGISGKVADMRASMDQRHEALLELTDLASSLLHEAGHNPTQDMLRRVTTTLEALSSSISLSDGPTPGRLTQDVDPPGFESLTSLMAGVPSTKPKKDLTRTAEPQKTPQKAAAVNAQKAQQVEEDRRVRIAVAKASLHEAKKSLSEARVRSQQLEAAQKKAKSDAKEADSDRREAEARLKRANAVAKEAEERARKITDDAREAAKEVDEGNRAVARATKELESLFRESM